MQIPIVLVQTAQWWKYCFWLDTWPHGSGHMVHVQRLNKNFPECLLASISIRNAIQAQTVYIGNFKFKYYHPALLRCSWPDSAKALL